MGLDVGVVLQQVGDSAEDGWIYAIAGEGLEQQQRLEMGVGGQAVIHPPVALDVGVCSARATRGRREGSHDGGLRASIKSHA